MHVVIATHGHCFDGLASAALFTRLFESLNGSGHRLVYRACGYGTGQLRPDAAVLEGEENAILDYRFFASPKLSWYFDHHQTAFGSDEDRQAFEERRPLGRFFFDSSYSSCTKLIRDVAESQFQVDTSKLNELVDWADRIDSARFDSADQAISRTEPMLRLATVIEHFGDDSFLTRMVPELLTKPIMDVASAHEIDEKYRPLGQKHERFVQRVRDKGQRMGRVVFVDLTEGVLESVGKFVTYALYPESTYSVIVGLLKSGAKISVGYNPWCGQPREHDISQICARYGGGGHPVVGGIAFDRREVERAREVARHIAEELA
ncbi:MAG TPA: hypothetical protein VI072_05740 [Polyangiaceae bacterium]